LAALVLARETVRVDRRVSLQILRDSEHYSEVVDRALREARVSVWIATANVKDVHLEAPVGTRARARGRFVSILEVFDTLAARGVELRLLHASPPSRRFMQRLARHRQLSQGGLEMRCCPRSHFKLVVVDGRLLYLGSANFTGAGIGKKSDGRRNFELGIVTEDELVLDELQSAFDAVWSGRRCGACRLRAQCPAPLDS
jgi:phosphatidylserine/phosphatidylglycerophosphate/cardiolipin synthase-like enzyme